MREAENKESITDHAVADGRDHGVAEQSDNGVTDGTDHAVADTGRTTG